MTLIPNNSNMIPVGLNRLFVENEILKSPSQEGKMPNDIKITTAKIIANNLPTRLSIISDNLLGNIPKYNIFIEIFFGRIYCFAYPSLSLDPPTIPQG